MAGSRSSVQSGESPERFIAVAKTVRISCCQNSVASGWCSFGSDVIYLGILKSCVDHIVRVRVLKQPLKLRRGKEL